MSFFEDDSPFAPTEERGPWGDFADFGRMQLVDFLRAGNYKKARRLMRGYLKKGQRLSENTAATCLVVAFEAPIDLFAELLALCDGVPALTSKTSRPSGTWHYFGHLLTLAAARDLPEQMQLLLDRGCDPNSASLDAMQGDINPIADSLLSFGRPALQNTLCAWNANRVLTNPRPQSPFGRDPFFSRQEYEWESLCNATPLAAAILCGSGAAAALLLERPDVWKEESSCVARALAMACARPQPESSPPPEGLARLLTLRLQPDAIADCCPVSMLKTQYEGGWYSDEEVRRVLRTLRDDKDSHDLPRKLLLTARYYPTLCREPWAAGVFLSAALRQKKSVRLFQCWKRLCGGVGDLSFAKEALFSMDLSELRALLKGLTAEGMHLVMDADSMGGLSAGRLTALLSRVEVRPSRYPEGISALAANVLTSGSLHLCRQVLRRGLLLSEPLDALLACCRENNVNPTLRALLLVSYEPGSPTVPTETPAVFPLWSYSDDGRWYKDGSTEDRENMMNMLFRDGGLTQAECRRLVLKLGLHPYGCLDFSDSIQTTHPRWGIFDAQNALHAACCGSGIGPSLLLGCREEWRSCVRENISHTFPQPGAVLEYELTGTPLCWAAAAGKNDKVQELLDLGESPDELFCGCHSYLLQAGFHTDVDEKRVTVTPFLCALLQGEEETARFLLSAGARCDFGETVFRQALFTTTSEEVLDLAARLPGVGFEHIPAEELDRFIRKLRDEDDIPCLGNGLFTF